MNNPTKTPLTDERTVSVIVKPIESLDNRRWYFDTRAQAWEWVEYQWGPRNGRREYWCPACAAKSTTLEKGQA